ncbi:DMT family transporter [Oryzibacter oryziterrae]|uniref:DMT family transporter n=1 Tax=Oryzibacter oryziterrae TaxID=2766474 RepID=UPI001F3E3937|nr:DMT family transporter [Oryzibacter oryziterrae]
MTAQLRAIFLFVLAFGLFAVLDASAKYAGRHLPVLEVVWFRYALHFLLAALILNPIASPLSWRMRHPVLQILRALSLAAMTCCNFLALRDLQLAQTVSIYFLNPLIISGLSALLLGEAIELKRLLAILTGFGGVLLVTRPGLGGFQPAMFFALGSTGFSAIYNMMTRHLALRETPGSMILILAGIPTLALTPALPFVWQTPDSATLWGLLIVVGAMGGLGHFLVILAHRHASAATLAPYSYSQIVWMIGLGYLAFGDTPDLWTLAGGAVVSLSGLYLLLRETRQRVKATATPA